MNDPASALADSFNEPDPTADEEARAAAEQAAAEKAAKEAADDAAAKAAADKAAADKAAADAAEKSKGEEKFVPLATHIEERNKLKGEIKELREQQSKVGGLEKELADAKARLAALEKPPEDKKAPDFVADPKGYVDATVTSLADKIRDMETKGKATEEQASQQQQLRDLERSIKSHVDAFADKTEDFDDALKYARELRLSELKDMYPDASDAQLQSALAVEEFRTAATLISQKRNPGEFIYSWAKKRGYSKAAPADDAAAKKAAEEEAAKMRAARDKAEGLGAGGGDVGDKALDAPADEFDEVMKEVFKR